MVLCSYAWIESGEGERESRSKGEWLGTHTIMKITSYSLVPGIYEEYFLLPCTWYI